MLGFELGHCFLEARRKKKILISQYWRLAIGDGESRELEERVVIFPKWICGMSGQDLEADLVLTC